MNITSTRAWLLPASEAYDYEDVRARLADPDLADAGVAVALLGVPLLAVPVGVRRGGYASFGHVVDALQVRALLGTVPGFSSARRRLASSTGSTARPPSLTDELSPSTPARRKVRDGPDGGRVHHPLSNPYLWRQRAHTDHVPQRRRRLPGAAQAGDERARAPDLRARQRRA
ncbi:DUF6302 family protein [Streptomyces platensis]